jgi:predicted MFS family arabinose efflux permease
MVVGGAVADRIDRRRILLTSQVIQMLLAVALGIFYVTDHLSIGAIVAVAFLTGLAQSQSAPTYQAVLTSLVPPPEIPTAVALNALQFNLSRAIGPVIAGLLLASAGAGFCFAANALSFVAVILALWHIEFPPPAPGVRQSLGESLKAGFRHLRANPVLSTLTALALVGSFLTFPLITYLPVIADDVLKSGAAGYSALLSSLGVGAIVGAISTAHRGKVEGRGKILLWAFIAFGLATTAALVSRSQIVSMGLFVISGASLTTAFSTLNSLVQEQAHDAFRGRILSLFGLAFRGGGPLGGLLAGVLVKPLGAPLVLGTYALLLVGLATLVFLRTDRVRAL